MLHVLGLQGSKNPGFFKKAQPTGLFFLKTRVFFGKKRAFLKIPS